MPKLNLIEKFDILFENVFAYPAFLVILIAPILIFFLSKKNKKKFNYLYLLIPIIVLVINYQIALDLLDNLVTYIVKMINFPSMGLVFLIVIINLIILLYSIFKNKNKIYLIINSIFFVIIESIFAINITLINKEKIDFTDEVEIFTNLNVGTLSQFIVMSFVLQIFILVFIKMVNTVSGKIDAKEEKIESINDSLEKTLIPKEENLALINEFNQNNLNEEFKNENDFDESKMPSVSIFGLEENMDKKGLDLANDGDEHIVSEEEIIPDISEILENENQTNNEKENILEKSEKNTAKSQEEVIPDISEILENEGQMNNEKENILEQSEENTAESQEDIIPDTSVILENENQMNNDKDDENKETQDIIDSEDEFNFENFKEDDEVPTYEDVFTSTAEPIKENKQVESTLVNEEKIAGVNKEKYDEEKNTEEIFNRVNEINTSSKFLTPEVKKQVEEELLLYKKQLEKIKAEEERKEQLRKEMEEYSSVFTMPFN